MSNLVRSLERKFYRAQLTSAKRIAMYEMILQLSHVGSIENALKQMIRVYTEEARRFADGNAVLVYVLEDVLSQLSDQGKSSGDAFKDYIPADELVILAPDGYISSESLASTIAFARSMKQLNSEISKKVAAPLLYLMGALGLLVVANIGLAPLVEMLNGEVEIPASVATLLGLSRFVLENFIWLIVGFIVLIFVIKAMLPRLSEYSVLRFIRLSVLDHIPPFSLYKKFVGIRLLIALSWLLGVDAEDAAYNRTGQNGNNSSKSSKSKKSSLIAGLRLTSRYANSYLNYFTQVMQSGVFKGLEAGEILADAKLLDRNTRALIKMYSYSDKLEQGLQSIGQDNLEQQIKHIGRMFSMINLFSLFASAAFAMWFALSMFTINTLMKSIGGA
ncbi:hypothetical protein [Cysteiniphilum marinum]|uniref:hypothetical protein n=1 Tax=Cysteiniphilum marinum TaxID=2774191 RepID=UPI00193A3C98|nr:hypothetical protein [Cysteiniphilum marinum]